MTVDELATAYGLRGATLAVQGDSEAAVEDLVRSVYFHPADNPYPDYLPTAIRNANTEAEHNRLISLLASAVKAYPDDARFRSALDDTHRSRAARIHRLSLRRPPTSEAQTAHSSSARAVPTSANPTFRPRSPYAAVPVRAQLPTPASPAIRSRSPYSAVPVRTRRTSGTLITRS